MSQRPTGILLANVGTPDAPRAREVRRYLREFLSDPRVIDINPLGRFLLLNLIILPFRPRLSAHAYRAIWTEQGSPLLCNSLQLRDRLRDRLREQVGDRFCVALGMRYGQPSMASALDHLLTADCARVILVPLFPQVASATTGTVMQHFFSLLAARDAMLPVEVRGAFFDQPAFVDALAHVHRPVLDAFKPDHLLLSFHGLPRRHVERTHGPDTVCDMQGACPPLAAHNRQCYRAQCFATARLLTDQLRIEQPGYSVAFQSRLGRTEWLRPYSDQILPELHARGVRRLAVSTPAFVTDCLETLEEIAIRLRDQWLQLGGEAFELVPCLNSNPRWVEALARIIEENGSPAAQ